MGTTPSNGRVCACGHDPEDRRIQLYGWDSRAETWHGPTQLSFPMRGSQRLLQTLRATAGKSWYGPVNCCAPRDPMAKLFALVHDVGDCALAMLYCDETKNGPVEILAAIPGEHRARLRREFAFEFLAFARFLGGVNEGAELAVHDLIGAALTEAPPGDALVFSISTGLWTSDLDHILSYCVERVAAGVLEWIADRAPVPQV